MKRIATPLIAAAVCFAAGLFFKFALRGYSFAAYAFFAVGAFIATLAALKAAEAKHAAFARTARRVLLCGLAVFLVALAVTEGFIISAAVRAEDDGPADCVIVLGAGVDGTRPSLSLLWRLREAKDWLDRYPEASCIVTGSQGPDELISEAQCMFTWLTDAGIAPERVIMEDMADDTEQNLRYSFAIAEERGFETLAVLTADYHVCRAALLAKANGRQAVMVAAPTAYPVLRANYYLREAFGLWYYKLTGRI